MEGASASSEQMLGCSEPSQKELAPLGVQVGGPKFRGAGYQGPCSMPIFLRLLSGCSVPPWFRQTSEILLLAAFSPLALPLQAEGSPAGSPRSPGQAESQEGAGAQPRGSGSSPNPPLPKAHGQQDELQAAHNRARRMRGSPQGWCLPPLCGLPPPQSTTLLQPEKGGRENPKTSVGAGTGGWQAQEPQGPLQTMSSFLGERPGHVTV